MLLSQVNYQIERSQIQLKMKTIQVIFFIFAVLLFGVLGAAIIAAIVAD